MSEIAAPRRNRFLLSQWAELLEDDSFRRFWIMRLASHGATNALSYSLLVFTVHHSQSAIATGLLLLTLIVPSALLGALAGVAVDRLPRGLILFTANLLRAALVFALIGAKDSLPALYLVSLSLGLVTQFAAPAEAAVLPDIVRSHRIVAANSFINLGTLVSQVLGMLILAPILLQTTNGDPLLFILIALFLVSAVLLLLIPQFHFMRKDQRTLSLRSMRREFAEGWMYVSRDAVAFGSLILLVVTNISTLIIATLMPKFSTQVLGIAPEHIVFVLAPVGIGVFLGLRSVEFLANRLNKQVTIGAGYLVMAASFVLLGLVPASAELVVDLNPLGVFNDGLLTDQAARIAATIFYGNMYGFSLTVVLTMGRVLLNERIPQSMQGRVFGAQAVLANLTAIVPVVLASLVADTVGVEPVLVFAGVAALVAAAWSQARASRSVPATGRISG